MIGGARVNMPTRLGAALRGIFRVVLWERTRWLTRAAHPAKRADRTRPGGRNRNAASPRSRPIKSGLPTVLRAVGHRRRVQLVCRRGSGRSGAATAFDGAGKFS